MPTYILTKEEYEHIIKKFDPDKIIETPAMNIEVYIIEGAGFITAYRRILKNKEAVTAYFISNLYWDESRELIRFIAFDSPTKEYISEANKEIHAVKNRAEKGENG